jgi:hypothetical protein
VEGVLPKLLTILTREGDTLTTFPSISAAAKSLEVSDNLLKRYADVDELFYIPLLGSKVRVIIDNRLKTKGPVVHPMPKVHDSSTLRVGLTCWENCSN